MGPIVQQLQRDLGVKVVGVPLSSGVDEYRAATGVTFPMGQNPGLSGVDTSRWPVTVYQDARTKKHATIAVGAVSYDQARTMVIATLWYPSGRPPAEPLAGPT